jgi:hypothetical protein
MILRAMRGGRGAAITSGVIGSTSSTTTTLDRAEKNARDLVSTKVMDIDGDGIVDPTRDGVVLMRAMLGLTGAAVTDGVTLPGPVSNWVGIRAYLNSRCAANLP